MKLGGPQSLSRCCNNPSKHFNLLHDVFLSYIGDTSSLTNSLTHSSTHSLPNADDNDMNSIIKKESCFFTIRMYIPKFITWENIFR